MNNDFNRQPTTSLLNKIDDSATVVVLSKDGKLYGNKDWNEIQSVFGRHFTDQRQPA